MSSDLILFESLLLGIVVNGDNGILLLQEKNIMLADFGKVKRRTKTNQASDVL